MSLILAAVVGAFSLTSPPIAAQGRSVVVEEVCASTIFEELNSGKVSSEELVRAYLDRIALIDRVGPTLQSMIAVNPDALPEAKQLDAERKAGKLRGPLHGLPILVKDNIETRDRMPTTAGSLALEDNVTGRDAPVIARLRAAGVIILGKTNLSEWTNVRSYDPPLAGAASADWQARNPYVLNRTTGGSSSGTAAGIAASLGAVGVGTETDGSVTVPSSMSGLVGLKPTMGLISRTHVIPITYNQDTPGAMGRSVRDVALLFSNMVGTDPTDPATKDADRYKQDYSAVLSPDALKGVRIGVIRPSGMPTLVMKQYDVALSRLKAAGAELIEVETPNVDGMRDAEISAMNYEFKTAINAYLASTPPAVKTRTLSDLIAFNNAHAARELGLFGQDNFERVDKLGGLDSPAYVAARTKALALARDAGLDVMLKANRVAALVSPTWTIPYLLDPGGGAARPIGSYSTPTMPAVAGYPHLTVPMGLVRGLPVGLSFIGPAYSDGELLRYGYGFEATAPLRARPQYLKSVHYGDLLEPLEP